MHVERMKIKSQTSLPLLTFAFGLASLSFSVHFAVELFHRVRCDKLDSFLRLVGECSFSKEKHIKR